jgi:membrane protein DedA with SNARE-associated domain
MIKASLIAAAGALAGALVVYALTFAVGWLFGPLYSSEDDMARNVKLYLGCSLIAALVGGCLAVRRYHR